MANQGNTRRNVLLGLGGALALAGAGGVWRVMRQPERAIAPWQFKPSPDIRLFALQHAILAPNPHNRQPWIITLTDHDTALIFCDLSRRLPQTDPNDRQIVIGFGCFAELAAIAAAERGFRAEIEAFPDGLPSGRLDTRPVLRIRFKDGLAPNKDPLFAHILARRSVKAPYSLDRPVPDDAVSRLLAEARTGNRFVVEQRTDRVSEMRDAITAAWMTELETARTHRESIELLRVGSQEIDSNPDGIPLKGAMFEALSLLGADDVRRQALDLASSASKGVVRRYGEIFAATPAFIWQISEGDDLRAAFEAGRSYLRLNLAATSRGLAMHPVSQALQEFPEMAEHMRKMNVRCGIKSGERLQMLARLGYAGMTGPTPRWPLEAKIRA